MTPKQSASLRQSASEKRQREQLEQARADLKRAEAEGDYWEILRAKQKEEDASYAE